MKTERNVTFEDVLTYCVKNGLHVVALSKKTVFEVVGNSDLNEGKGSPRYHGRFMTKELAKDASKGKGVMGFEADVVAREVQVVTFANGHDGGASDTHYCLGEQVHTFDPEKAKRAALDAVMAKLTINDVNVLRASGLKLPDELKGSR